ncbi:MAG TPA: hypothetical protein VF507_05420, partial [Pyrinomonadaceae bacterium]
MDSNSTSANQHDGQASERAAGRDGAARLPEAARAELELGLWLRALGSFFDPRHHPLSESERARVQERDWTNEVRIARRALLRALQLTLQTQSRGAESLSLDAGEAGADSPESAGSRALSFSPDQALVELSESLRDAHGVSEALLEKRPVEFHTWASFGNTLARDLARSASARGLTQTASQMG